MPIEHQLPTEAIDRLIFDAVFDGSEQVRNQTRQLIRETAKSLGIQPKSIQGLYEAIGRGAAEPFTVPAINIRGLAYDTARGVYRAARKLNVGAFVFEIARSEMGYTSQTPDEFVVCMLAAAIKEDYRGAVFVQGDHFQVSAKNYSKDPQAELSAVRELIDKALAAGFYQIDVDTSTLVDLSKPTLQEQQRVNFEQAAMFTEYIRRRQPAGVTVLVGAEIGEVGGQNSTPAEFRAFMTGYLSELKKRDGNLTGISKISIQTGTSHGGVVMADGSIADVKIDFTALEAISKIAKHEYGLAGAVQHGASTLPEEMFGKFVEAGACEVHLATAFQNLMYESQHLPADFRDRLYDWIRSECASERKPRDTDEQFIYKTRKKAYGPFKREWWSLPDSVKKGLGQELEKRFELLFDRLAVKNTRDVVAEFVK